MFAVILINYKQWCHLYICSNCDKYGLMSDDDHSLTVRFRNKLANSTDRWFVSHRLFL